jgi:hypothetical protein
MFSSVLRIRIRRIHLFLGHPDPDPETRIRILLSPSKIVRKTLIPTVLWLPCDVFSLKKDVNVPSKSNKQTNILLMMSWRWLTKIAGPDPLVRGMDPRIRTKFSWIRNTGFIGAGWAGDAGGDGRQQGGEHLPLRNQRRSGQASLPVHPQNIRFQNVRFQNISKRLKRQVYKTSGLQNVRFTKRQVYKTSGLQNVRFTKRQVFKTSGCKKASIYTLILVIGGNPQVLLQPCLQAKWWLCFILYFRGFFVPYITIISNHDTLITNLAIPILFVW